MVMSELPTLAITWPLSAAAFGVFLVAGGHAEQQGSADRRTEDTTIRRVQWRDAI